MDYLDEKKIGKDKMKALELAEDSREQEWTLPSFVAELFKGKVRWDLLLPYPHQSEEEKKIGDDMIAKVTVVLKRLIDPEKVDETGEMPKEALAELAKLGCFALKIPKEYGGLGLSQVNYNRVVHAVASHCGSTAVWLSAHQSIGVPQPLKLFGTEEQKRKYFPMFAKGAISAFALTEPDVGSDPARMKTTAVPTEDGKAFLLSGEKLWCTNGPDADVMVVMAQTAPKVVGGREKKQITAFIVEKTMPGIEVIHRCKFMGLHGISNGLLRFTNVRVPRENIILGEGKGLKLALTTLNTGRLTIPAAVTGASKVALRISRKWANERVQWGAPVGHHEAVAMKLAAMASTVYAMDAVTHVTSCMADDKHYDFRLEAAMAKLSCTEAAWKVIDGAVQVRGGRGYETSASLKARGEKPYPLERMLRDIRINTIIEGTSQIMRLFIAREAMDFHVRRIMPILSRSVSMGKKIMVGIASAGFYSLWYPTMYFPGSQLPSGVSIPVKLRRHMAFVGKRAKKLGRALFHSMMLYQQSLEKKQHLLGRLVNVGADLYAMSCACSRAISESKNNPSDPGPVELADLFCRQSSRRVERNLRNLFGTEDAFAGKVSRNFLDGKYLWIEKDILPE